MVGIGTLLAALGVVHLFTLVPPPAAAGVARGSTGRVVAAGPLSLVALLAGWVATEVGRQPWVVYGVMRTSEAVTGADGVPVGYATLVVVYVGAGRGRRLDPAPAGAGAARAAARGPAATGDRMSLR